MKARKYYDKDGNLHRELDPNGGDETEGLPRLPLYADLAPTPYQSPAPPVFVLGGSGDLKQDLGETALLSEEAQAIFQDPSLEGMLKAAVLRENQAELGLERGERVPYLESAVSDYVGNGFLKNYRTAQAQGDSPDPYRLPLLDHIYTHVEPEQYGLFCRTGLYVENNIAYQGSSGRQVADLTQYVTLRDAA